VHPAAVEDAITEQQWQQQLAPLHLQQQYQNSHQQQQQQQQHQQHQQYQQQLLLRQRMVPGQVAVVTGTAASSVIQPQQHTVAQQCGPDECDDSMWKTDDVTLGGQQETRARTERDLMELPLLWEVMASTRYSLGEREREQEGTQGRSQGQRLKL
jgi:hypothetical protein